MFTPFFYFGIFISLNLVSNVCTKWSCSTNQEAFRLFFHNPFFSSSVAWLYPPYTVLISQSLTVKQCISLRQDNTPLTVKSRLMTHVKVAGESGDTGAEIQHGSSQRGFWGGSFCESWEQHHRPRGSSASLCAGVRAHFESRSCCVWSKFRRFASKPCLQCFRDRFCALMRVQW